MHNHRDVYTYLRHLVSCLIDTAQSTACCDSIWGAFTRSKDSSIRAMRCELEHGQLENFVVVGSSSDCDSEFLQSLKPAKPLIDDPKWACT